MNGTSIELELNKQKTIAKVSDKVFYNTVKRLFDLVVSGLSLILLSPVFLIIALAVKLDSKGKVIFKQERIGKNGKPIYIYKFRSMIVNAEEELERLMRENENIRNEYMINKKLKNDPRVTRIGRFLRKTSLDELPQLLNIFMGDMTFVGPRPYLYRESNDMKPYYNHIISMTPGLTGLWQVSGRSDLTFTRRCRLDNQYYYNRGLKQDLIILIKTVKVVLFGNGAC